MIEKLTAKEMIIKSDTSLKEETGYKRFIPEYIFILEPESGR
jgi:hypothetical protein